MTDRLPTALRDATIRWLADDPSPTDKAELQKILADAMAQLPGAVADLADRMSAPLTFGTAGLRGPLRAGPAGMNLAVVRRAAAGLAAYLTASGERGSLVVVGHDARHRSAEFAADVAGVLAAARFSVLLAPGPLPTPVTAFAVRSLQAAAGVQITASHNPPQDNGMKVYLRGGAQLVSPDDVRIEEAIAAAPPAIRIDTARDPDNPRTWPSDVLQSYIDRAGQLADAGAAAAALRVAATPMHGVGGETLVRALHLAGVTDVHVVPEQAAPDGDFPTVTFPNPEEPGAADLLLALADEVGADLAVALDPDADRCALGVREENGRFRMLSGDETGALLGDHVLEKLDRVEHPDPLVATTIVSGELLADIAATRGARYAETLTGFKWIMRAGADDAAGPASAASADLVFGYEEALGLSVDPDHVRDKDGITAAVVACGLAATLKAQGQSITDRLDEIARRHGLVATGQVSMRVTDLSLIAAAMTRIRSAAPAELLGDPVTDVTDLRPQTDAMRVRTDRARVVVRPSGTEPKLKCYLQVRAAVDPDADAAALADVRAAARRDLDALGAEISAALGIQPG